jgi:hypothetical protein
MLTSALNRAAGWGVPKSHVSAAAPVPAAGEHFENQTNIRS